MHERITAPRPLRVLKAKAVEKGLRLSEIAAAAEVPYKTTSQILGGRLIRPNQLARIAHVIETAEEVA